MDNLDALALQIPAMPLERSGYTTMPFDCGKFAYDIKKWTCHVLTAGATIHTMSKNDELNAAVSQDEAQWQEIEQEVSKVHPRDAARLKSLFESRKQSLQKSQKREAEGKRFLAFVHLMNVWSLQTKINKLVKKLAESD